MADLKFATDDFPYTQYPEIEPLTKVVCDIGDVLLVADDGSHSPLRIQASSVLLSTASKVFRTLFRGRFAEGEAMRNAAESPAEIRVSDCPADLLLLCQLLHFQGDLQNVTHQRFLDLAVIIDKYDCAKALRHATTSKFAALRPDDLGQTVKISYLAAAWILDQPEAFRRLSKSIVTCHEYGPAALGDRYLDILPAECLTSIHAQRVFTGRELTYHLSKFITRYHAAAFALNATAYSNELTKTMLSFDLWPLDLRVYSLAFLFGELREYHVPIMQADILTGQSTNTLGELFELDDSEYIRLFGRPKPAKVVTPPTKFELVHIVERIELFCVGLCLDCLKGNKTCRVKHTDPFSEDLWIPLRNMGSDCGPDYGADTKRPVDWESIW